MDFKNSVTRVLRECFKDISFTSQDHSYWFGGKRAYSSVTQLLKKYEKSFDVEKISRIVAAKQGILVEDVRTLWDFKRDYASIKGTMLHFYIENYLQNKKIPLDKKQISKFVSKYSDYISVEQFYTDMAKLILNFLDFYQWWEEKYELICPELIVGDFETNICGSVDNLSYNKKDQSLVIFDYKSNSEIKTSSKDKMLFELNHLDSCELVKYSLQLNLYASIIERNTPLRVDRTYIVSVGQRYNLIETLNVKEEVRFIFKKLKSENSSL